MSKCASKLSRNDALQLKIYYGNLLTTETEQVSSYTFGNFSGKYCNLLQL